VVVIVWKLDLQLPMQSVPITTDVVSSNLDQSEVIKFVSDLRQVDGFLQVLRFPPPIKLTKTLLWGCQRGCPRLILRDNDHVHCGVLNLTSRTKLAPMDLCIVGV
jgi:hypothetical protein